jgi:flagellar motor switch protein FliN
MSTPANRALLELGESTATAVAGVLEQLAPGGIERGTVTVAGADADPFAGAALPAVAAAVSYVHGVKGGNLFVVSVPAALRLAMAMMGMEQPEDLGDAELGELEMSAVSEAANQMLATAAAATSTVLGEGVEIGVPQTRLVEAAGDARELWEHTPHATTVSFSIFGESCRLVQLVPNAFVVRMSRALGAQSGAILDENAAPGGAGTFDAELLRGVSLRVWAELGRAVPPIGRTIGLQPGSVLELDKAVDDPVDLYVNGRRFATGRLLVVDDGDWAVQIDTIEPVASLGSAIKEGAS